MLKISVVLKRGKSSAFQCRNPFPRVYSGEYVASFDQFGSDILISFIFLSCPKANNPNFTLQHIT